MLAGKTILLAAGGSIAAYKLPILASQLVKKGALVYPLLSRGAERFVAPAALETMTGHKVWRDCFDDAPEGFIPHIALAAQADLLLVAPASANQIARLAAGMADDIITQVALAATCPKIIAPSMNVHMLENPATIENLAALRGRGWSELEPAYGRLACGYEGRGKFPEPETIVEYVEQFLGREENGSHPGDFCGQKVLVTAGPTREAIDAVRFITNHSSGKMGYALAEAAQRRGATVTLISGPVNLRTPNGVTRQDVVSAAEMAEAVLAALPKNDILIMAAAVADFRPCHSTEGKIKKDTTELTLPLEKTTDILNAVAERRIKEQIICGFAMETEALEQNAEQKLKQKNLDLICANALNQPGAGFAGDTNLLTLISAKGEVTHLPLMSKAAAADRILDTIMDLSRRQKDYMRS